MLGIKHTTSKSNSKNVKASVVVFLYLKGSGMLKKILSCVICIKKQTLWLLSALLLTA